MHNFEDRINQWRDELMTGYGLQAERVDEIITQLQENLDDVLDLDLSANEKFALAKYRTRDATNIGNEVLGNEPADQAEHQYGLGDLALMIGGYLLFGLFFSLLQFIAIPLTSLNGFMQSSPDLAFIIYTLSSAILIAAFTYGIWRFAQTDSIGRLFGYKSHKPNTALTIFLSALAVYCVLNLQEAASFFGMFAIFESEIIHAEWYVGFNTTAMSYSRYTSLLLPTIFFILLMWIQHIKYAIRNQSADPTHV